MAADLHIHVLTDGFVEEHYVAFCSNSLGSKYFRGLSNLGYQEQFEKERGCDLYMLCSRTPNVWVGRVSWFDETTIPDTVAEVVEVIGEDFPAIDRVLIDKVRVACELPNNVDPFYSLAKTDDVVEFLEQHRGKKAFTISW